MSISKEVEEVLVLLGFTNYKGTILNKSPVSLENIVKNLTRTKE